MNRIRKGFFFSSFEKTKKEKKEKKPILEKQAKQRKNRSFNLINFFLIKKSLIKVFSMNLRFIRKNSIRFDSYQSFNSSLNILIFFGIESNLN